MLRTSLDAHRNIICLSEMFNPDYTSGNYPYTENTPEQEILEQYIFPSQKWRIQAVGFCLHRTHARLGNWPHLWETLAAIPDLLIVSLHRRNLLRRYLSFQLRPRPEVPRLPPAPLVLERSQLVADFEHQTAKIAEFDGRFHDHPLLTLAYEDLCTDYEATMRGLQTFLKVPYRALKPATPKLTTQSLRETIQNYGPLKQEFADTQWADFFDD
jgi:hypothetical protein